MNEVISIVSILHTLVFVPFHSITMKRIFFIRIVHLMNLHSATTKKVQLLNNHCFFNKQLRSLVYVIKRSQQIIANFVMQKCKEYSVLRSHGGGPFMFIMCLYFLLASGTLEHASSNCIMR